MMASAVLNKMQLIGVKIMRRKFMNMQKYILMMVSLAGFLVGGSVAVAGPPQPLVLSVAAHGHAAFHTIQAAINAVPVHSHRPVVIKIAAGTYKERVTIPSDDSHVALIGAGARKTIITYNLGAKEKSRLGHEIGTFHTPTVTILGRDISAAHLTFVNTYGKGSQAVAVRTGDGPVMFTHCRFIGWQDTLYLHNPHARIYLHRCMIQGAIDFIFGKSRAVFDHCLIRSVGKGCITAPATPPHQPFGFVFLHCRLVATKAVHAGSVHLGRPWRPYGYVAFIHCSMGRQIAPDGWLNWDRTTYYKTARFYEFGSTGPGAGPAKRVRWSHQLTPEKAAGMTVRVILGRGPWSRKNRPGTKS